MGEVAILAEYQPWFVGHSTCLACGASWVEACPMVCVRTKALLECPHCHQMQGCINEFDVEEGA